jgi:hypothetical protein
VTSGPLAPPAPALHSAIPPPSCSCIVFHVSSPKLALSSQESQVVRIAAYRSCEHKQRLYGSIPACQACVEGEVEPGFHYKAHKSDEGVVLGPVCGPLSPGDSALPVFATHGEALPHFKCVCLLENTTGFLTFREQEEDCS